MKDNQQLLHVLENESPVGLIILTELGDDENCYFEGKIFEISLALYDGEQAKGAGKLALKQLNDWVMQRYVCVNVRLEAVITEKNPSPESIEKVLTYAGFMKGEDVCKCCRRDFCAIRGMLNEWRKDFIGYSMVSKE